MFKGIDHVIYFVNDLPRARKFYHETLQLPLVFDAPDFVGVDFGGVWLGLHPTETGGQDIGAGALAYLAVDDIQAALTELRGRGVEILHDVSAVGGYKIATILDSEGNPLGLSERL